jgi:hypothetical protein
MGEAAGDCGIEKDPGLDGRGLYFASYLSSKNRDSSSDRLLEDENNNHWEGVIRRDFNRHFERATVN